VKTSCFAVPCHGLSLAPVPWREIIRYMRRSFPLYVAILILLVSYGYTNSLDQKPTWRIDLQDLGYGEGDLTTIAFCGPVLVIYPDGSGSRLLFDAATHQRISGQRIPGISALCDDSSQRQLTPANSGGHVVARWKQLLIEQVCNVESCSQPPGKPAVRDVKYYLKKPDKRSVLLFHDHCLARHPQFLGDEYVLFFRCDLKGVVINSDGEQVYRLPVFSFPYITVSGGGARFAVFERDESFFHELAGTTDRARVGVFQSSNGKKLFHLAWHIKGESTREGRVALSDDGLLVAVVRSGEVLVFPLPAS
jgi:hypothetical protein